MEQGRRELGRNPLDSQGRTGVVGMGDSRPGAEEGIGVEGGIGVVEDSEVVEGSEVVVEDNKGCEVVGLRCRRSPEFDAPSRRKNTTPSSHRSFPGSSHAQYDGTAQSTPSLCPSDVL